MSLKTTIKQEKKKNPEDLKFMVKEEERNKK